MGVIHVHIDPKMSRNLSVKTGLSEDAVNELLAAGWRYVEKRNEISRWEHPMWALDNILM